MKTKLRHISRRTIAMILCILMMFSTLMVGSISTNATTNVTLYCKCEQSWWTKDSAAVGIEYTKDSNENTDNWTQSLGTKVSRFLWKFDVPSDSTYVRFWRVDGNNASFYGWGARSNSLAIPNDGNNLYTITSSTEQWISNNNYVDGEWSKFAECGYFLRGKLNGNDYWDPGLCMNGIIPGYAYYKTSGDTTFKITDAANGWNCTKYDSTFRDTNKGDIPVADDGSDDKNCKITGVTGEYYIIFDYTDTNTKKIYASTNPPSNTHSVTFKPSTSEGGTIKVGTNTATSGSQTVEISDTNPTDIVADPSTGYQFKNWTVDTAGAVEFDNANAASTNITAKADNATVTANFEKIDYTIAKQVDAGGSLTVKKGGTDVTTANYNDTITGTVTVNKVGYHLDSLKYFKTGSTTDEGTTIAVDPDDGTYSFSMPDSNITLKATITKNRYAVTYTGDNVAFNSDKVTVADFESEVTFKVEANDYYSLKTSDIKLYNKAAKKEATDLVLTDKGNNTYSFIQPDYTVEVKANATLNTYTVNLVGNYTKADHDDGDFTEYTNVDGITGVEITAPTVEGYEFVMWTTTGSITVDNAKASTTTLKATGSDGVLRANYVSSEKRTYYFLNTPGWTVTHALYYYDNGVETIYPFDIDQFGDSPIIGKVGKYSYYGVHNVLKIEISKDYETVIINNGYQGDVNQTCDLHLNESKAGKLYVGGSYKTNQNDKDDNWKDYNAIPVNFVVDNASAATLTASYKDASTNSIAFSSGELVPVGSPITITPTFKAGYEYFSYGVPSGVTPTIDASTKALTFTLPNNLESVTVTLNTSLIEYNVNCETVEGGTVTVDKNTATIDDTVKINVVTNQYYELTGLTVKKSDNSEVTVTPTSGSTNTYTFTMPASNVTVTPTFKKLNYIYLKNSAGWDTPTAYAYSNNGNERNDDWPGVAMEDAGGGYYRIEVTKPDSTDTFTDIIFSDNGDNNKRYPADQAGGLAINEEKINKKYFDNGNLSSDSWYDLVTYTYNVNINTPTNGTVTANQTGGNGGETITLTVTPNSHFKLATLTVKDGSNATVNTSKVNDTTYTFTMPASNVTVSAVFESDGTAPVVGEPTDWYLQGRFAGTNYYDDAEINFRTSENDKELVAFVYFDTTDRSDNEFKIRHKTGNSQVWYYGGSTAVTETKTGIDLVENSSALTDLARKSSVNGLLKFVLHTDTDTKKLDIIYPTASDVYIMVKPESGSDYPLAYSTGGTSPYTMSANLPANTTYSIYIKDSSNNYYAGGGGISGDTTGYNFSTYNDNNYQYVSFKTDKAGIYNFSLTKNSSTQYGLSVIYPTTGGGGDTPSQTYTIIGKDGTIRNGYMKYASMADTKLTITTTNTDGTTTNTDGVDYPYDSVTEAVKVEGKAGDTITITTTIDATNRGTYQVMGWVVNGETIGYNPTVDKTNGKYTTTYKIPTDEDELAKISNNKNTIEITPVYYYIDDPNAIILQVEGFDDTIQSNWGNTLAAFAYYNGIDAEKNNALGGYPGQPLLKVGGKYYIQIPDKLVTGETEKLVRGVTLNNYYFDTIHQSLLPSGIKHSQTYDYDDFVRIAHKTFDENHTLSSIIFHFKYFTQEDGIDNSTTVVPSDDNMSQFNDFEFLTDLYGNKVDLFGNKINTTITNVKDANIRIVSNGYCNYNYVGEYATEWYVYKKETNGTWTKLGVLPPSAFLFNSVDELDDEMTSTQKVNANYSTDYDALKKYVEDNITKNSTDKNVAVISYEKEIAKNDSNRSDGRWNYSFTEDRVTSNLQIEYGDTKDGTFTTDIFETDSNKGKKTQASVNFVVDDKDTNVVELGNYGTTASALRSNTDNFNFTTDLPYTTIDGSTYQFVGWYLKSGNNYSYIGNKLTESAHRTGNDTYVARYVKSKTGTLTVSHSAYTSDVDTTVHNGSGKYEVKVEVLNNSGNKLTTYEYTTNAIVVDTKYLAFNDNNKIKVYLKTTPSGLDKFVSFYTKGITDTMVEYPDSETKAVYEHTFEYDVKNLYDTEGTVQLKNSLNYYSALDEVNVDYSVKFKFKDRSGADKYYIKNGTLDKGFVVRNASNGSVSLTKGFIESLAPDESNFMKNLTWADPTDMVPGTSTTTASAVVEAVQTDKTVIIKYQTTYNGPFNNINCDYGVIPKVDNAYIKAAETATVEGVEKEFSYWEIKPLYGAENQIVSKCYNLEFNYVAMNSYVLTPVYEGQQIAAGEQEVYSELEFLEYSRNQWTEENADGTVTTNDILYMDFASTFWYNGKQLSSLDPKSDKVKCGYVVENIGYLKPNSAGTGPETNMSEYANTPEYVTQIQNGISGLINQTTGENKNSFTIYNDELKKNKKVVNYSIANNSLTNKNRIEYYIGKHNTQANRNYVLRVYAYIYDSVTQEVTLSNPQYVNLYNIGS